MSALLMCSWYVYTIHLHSLFHPAPSSLFKMIHITVFGSKSSWFSTCAIMHGSLRPRGERHRQLGAQGQVGQGLQDPGPARPAPPQPVEPSEGQAGAHGTKLSELELFRTLPIGREQQFGDFSGSNLGSQFTYTTSSNF